MLVCYPNKQTLSCHFLVIKIEVNSLVFISFSTEILPKIYCVIQRNM